MTVTQIVSLLESGAYDKTLTLLYGEEISATKKRMLSLTKQFLQLYGDREACFFSVPGRTEISGNHTDHNGGRVLAAAVNIDILALASKTDDRLMRVKSEGYREDVVSLDELQPTDKRQNNSESLVAGVCRYFADKGWNRGGFCACTTSLVTSGSGLSSSAAFEVMMANILSRLYNGGTVSPIELAKAGKYAENVFFGKPCGLMDQAACAHGGLLYIDFADTDSPVTEKLNLDIASLGYKLFIVDVGASHADLTDDYAAVPYEMKACAAAMGKSVLRECDRAEFISKTAAIRSSVGDRAVLRAMHFFDENERVEKQKAAIKENDIGTFFKLVTESGNSSYKYLQNVYTCRSPREQALSLALYLTEREGLTCRVHGGGFAGTIQAYVPFEKCDGYRELMESVFGNGCCKLLSIRPYGAVMFDESGIYEQK